MTKKITYGPNYDVVSINSLSDEIRFSECMRLYKSHETINDLDNALTDEAKAKMRKFL